MRPATPNTSVASRQPRPSTRRFTTNTKAAPKLMPVKKTPKARPRRLSNQLLTIVVEP